MPTSLGQTASSVDARPKFRSTADEDSPDAVVRKSTALEIFKRDGYVRTGFTMPAALEEMLRDVTRSDMPPRLTD